MFKNLKENMNITLKEMEDIQYTHTSTNIF